MTWAVIIILVLLIALLALVLDSAVGKAIAERISKEGSDPEREDRMEALEAEVQYLSETLESLREETEFVRSLIEGSGQEGEDDRRRLGTGE